MNLPNEGFQPPGQNFSFQQTSQVSKCGKTGCQEASQSTFPTNLALNGIECLTVELIGLLL